MNQYQEIFQRLQNKSKELGVALSGPATREDLAELERAINQKLPKDIFDFYSFSDGFDTDDYMFRILPIKDILENKHEFETNSFCFAEYSIYCDTWSIQIENSEKYIIFNGDQFTKEKVILTNSIYKFLERYLSGDGIFGEKGIENWSEEIKEKKITSPNIKHKTATGLLTLKAIA